MTTELTYRDVPLSQLWKSHQEVARLKGVVNVLADELARFTGKTVPDEIERARKVVDNADI